MGGIRGMIMSQAKEIFQLVIGAIVLLVAPTLLLSVTGNDTMAAVVGSVTVMLVVGGGVAVAYHAGGRQTKEAMQNGADLAMRSQDFKSRWDVQETAMMARLFQEGARIGARSLGSGGGDMPALPLPSQSTEWMPALSVFEDSAGRD